MSRSQSTVDDSGQGNSPIPFDGRQSQRAAEIARGTARMLAGYGMRAIPELALPNGRRADLIAIGEAGEVWIVEVKSSLEDFRSDHKWPDYREFSDRLFFAVAADFPRNMLPSDTGLIIADRYGGDLVREAPEHRLAGARRKALTLRVARVAAARLMSIYDPEQIFEA